MYYEAIDRWSSPDSYLEHHGVKGMKWGVRKEKISSGKARRNSSYSSSPRKKMSTGKKVAIGVLAAAGTIAAAYAISKNANAKAALDYVKDEAVNRMFNSQEFWERPKEGIKNHKKYNSLSKQYRKNNTYDDWVENGMGTPEFKKAMKTSVRSITRGPSIMVTGGGPGSNELSRGLKNQSRISANFSNARTRDSIHSTPNSKRKMDVAFRNKNRIEDVNQWGYHSESFSPLMTTKTGDRISDKKYLTRSARRNRHTSARVKEAYKWPMHQNVKSYLV